jgi:hypothetical protein
MYHSRARALVEIILIGQLIAPRLSVSAKKFPCDKASCSTPSLTKRHGAHQMPSETMESSSKRRKIDHESIGLRHAGLIDFESRNTARVSAASTFVLQTDELLKQAKLKYEKALRGVDGQLHRLKSIIDSIEPHDPRPVSITRYLLAQSYQAFLT